MTASQPQDTNKDSYAKAADTQTELLIEEHKRKFESKMQSIAALENIIKDSKLDTSQIQHIGDAAGGLGHNAYHIRNMFPNAKFEIIDILEKQVDIANTLFKEKGISDKFHAIVGDLYTLPKERYDLTLCWNTLFCVDDLEAAVSSLISATKKDGHIFVSLLLNNHDVDIFAKMIDRTRSAAQEKNSMSYNTYSKKRFLELCKKLGSQDVKIHPFDINIDLPDTHPGIGTYTIKTDSGKRLQVSGGLLMNWVIVDITR